MKTAATLLLLAIASICLTQCKSPKANYNRLQMNSGRPSPMQ